MTPRETPDLIGHDAAEAALARAAAGARLHHAWLIGGPMGVGKATLAYRFARWLLAARPPTDPPLLALDPSSGVYRRVAADTHADLMTVERQFDAQRGRAKAEIAVDDVRAVTDFLRLTPAEGGWRVVVVDGAEYMNRSSANSLLKVLEEPPRRSVLLLVSHAPGLLLPTLRSRCRALTLSGLDEVSMRRLLSVHLPDLDRASADRLIGLADGSIGRALMLAAADGIAYADLAAEVLERLEGLGTARMNAIAERVARGEGGVNIFIDLLRQALARSVRAAARGSPDAAGARLAALRPLDGWAEVWHGLGRLQRDTEDFYLDKRQAVVNALRLLA